MGGFNQGQTVRHLRFGRGQVVIDQGQSVVVRFAQGLEECLPEELGLLLGMADKLRDGRLGDPLSAMVHGLALSIRSVNDQWGVFSRSRIALLPHQLWVCRKVREHWPARWLIADDVGLGKTIEAGLILLPLVASGLVRRLLILAPANLVPQWQERLRVMFDLRLGRYVSEIDDARGDFWGTHPMVVASFHTLRLDGRGQRERVLDADPFDLVMVDEAHHLNVNERQGATLAYELVRELQERGKVNGLIFFTGTPHRGKDYGFLALLQLVRPDLFDPAQPVARQWPLLRDAVIRNNKQAVTDLQGNRLFQPVKVETATFGYSPAEQRFYDTLSEFILTGKAYASGLSGSEQQSVMLVLITMQKLAASSVAAVRRALEKRLTTIEQGTGRFAELEARLERLRMLHGEGDPDQADEISRLEEQIAEAMTLKLMEDEAPRLRDLLTLADEVRDETKIAHIAELIRDRLAGEQVLLFTEYKATQALMMNALQRVFGLGCAIFINGDEALDGVLDAQGRLRQVRMPRTVAADSFNAGEVRFLVSTEAAGEGIDLQERCATLIHVDLPWNPMRLHQRVGRLNRYGQTRPVVVFNLRNPDTVESRIWDKLNEKLERISMALRGIMDEPEDMLQLVLGMTSPGLFNDLFAEATAVSKERLVTWFDEKTKTFGGHDVVETVKQLIGNVQRFDFRSFGRDVPKVDLPDLLPFLRYALAINNRRLSEDDGYVGFITPDSWRKKDFAILQRYEGLVLDRNLSGRDAAQRVLGVGHRVFDAALGEALQLDVSPAVLPDLKEPLFLFVISDRITGTGSQVPRVVVGVVPTESGGIEILSDWEAIQRLNRLKILQRGGSEFGIHEGTGAVTARATRASEALRARVDELRLGFRLPDLELVGAFLPSPNGDKTSPQTHSSTP